MPWRPNGRRFRRLSLFILRPVQETSAIVRETSDIDNHEKCRCSLFPGLGRCRDLVRSRCYVYTLRA